MTRPWEADPNAAFERRLGKSALELGGTNATPSCPDIWELDNGDIAVIGRDMTAQYTERLPHGISIVSDERLVVIPRNMIVAAKPTFPMLERVAGIPGQDLKLDAYLADFESRFWQVDSSWKLERRQVFQEPDVPSWAAMAEGDRERALLLADEMRESIAEHQRRLDVQGIVQQRVRVVELPLSDYLWWELYVLRIRAGLGERIRVLHPSEVASWETAGTLPEIIVLGDRILYQVRYDRQGIATGAKLLTDPDIAAACRDELTGLWQQGEDLADFLTSAGVPADAHGVV